VKGHRRGSEEMGGGGEERGEWRAGMLRAVKHSPLGHKHKYVARSPTYEHTTHAKTHASTYASSGTPSNCFSFVSRSW
jgi:hypothetical protein